MSASGVPYAVPANYVIRLVEEPLHGGAPVTTPHTQEPVQPHAHPSHFQFPRTSLHEATLQSHFSGPHAAGSVAAPKPANVWVPATDIRETMRAYHIEIETPGVTDKNDIVIQWMSPHTLLVQGSVKRPKNIGLLDPKHGDRVWEGEGEGWAQEAGHAKAKDDSADGGPIERTPSRETIEAQLRADAIPTVLLAERKLGPWRRTFTLPEDVEMKELKARLDGGLLRIDLPKRSLEEVEQLRGGGIRIEIE
ncbi:hypothetical protein HRR83_008644 [Exophiala dermatitidis]|uniref:SHSP domain-containing protein n=2 Tax=Exophiala dermatitidis TaxID=5970 RepID=H6BWX1_EXODN|nr:uncharacterized protein HMPREF1120_04224 [Exophiala dermatitidis NIH/UT8656]KAJ4503838.1 hypothetical protein HRR75_007861 [Exophiala dermatitidis]EHY56127.1 hypothetical protein HMPREF1120_04224 [Exophiala dermatitidis NIH/UT8656]KAJ4505186.1 hypothetical protein HRR73_008459 [Exophiala dermatitidis]KAJ4505645.1 hypothetical protein HRR74_008556 [Exophiala dermatitidis]KAJ4536430.1 hypothetical protein HRR77_007349 [Exophiala dermatitidis]